MGKSRTLVLVRSDEALARLTALIDGLPWARLLQLQYDLDALEAWGAKRSGVNSPDGAYLQAWVRLERNDPKAAREFADKVDEQWRKNPDDLYRYSEVEGRYLVETLSKHEERRQARLEP